MSKELVPVQQTRVITVWDQRDRSSQEVHTAATTWGEFKKQVRQEISFTNVRGVVRETKNVLEVDDALLPEQGFTMFLFPKKVKSGLAMTKAEYENNYGSKELRKMCSDRKLGTSGSKADFAKKLADDDKKKLQEVKTDPKIKPVIVTKSPAETKVVAPVSSTSAFPAVIEMGTVDVAMKLRITDKDALGSLLEAQFPHANVVSIDAVIDLKAKLSLATGAVPTQEITPEPVKEEVPVPAKPKADKPKAIKTANVAKKSDKLPPENKDVKAAPALKEPYKAPSDKDLASEADDMVNMFK